MALMEVGWIDTCCYIRYGKLTKVVTRGNGHIGTNITHLSTAIDGILQTIPYKGHLVHPW